MAWLSYRGLPSSGALESPGLRLSYSAKNNIIVHNHHTHNGMSPTSTILQFYNTYSYITGSDHTALYEADYQWNLAGGLHILDNGSFVSADAAGHESAKRAQYEGRNVSSTVYEKDIDYNPLVNKDWAHGM